MKFVAALSVVASLMTLGPTGAHAAQTLRIGTVAPKGSTWGKALAAWEKIVVEKTQGEVTLQVYYNAIQGDERTMVSKLRTGQLDGAALSSVGLSNVYHDVMTLQLPGVSNSWALLDMMRNIMRKPMEDGFKKEGFDLVAWGDLGLVYQMSRGFAVRRPSDLKGHHPLVFRNEPMGPLLFSLIGEVVPVPRESIEVLPALRAGMLDVVAGPALAAEQLQWVPYLDHLNEQIVLAAIGGTIIRTSTWEAIPSDTRDMLAAVQRRVAAAQSERIRKLDQEAFERLKKKMTVVQSSDDDRVEWYRVFLKAVRRLRQGILSPALVDQVLAITGKG